MAGAEGEKAVRRRKPRAPRAKPVAPVPSGVESVVLPERSVHVAGQQRSFRARRSAGRLPALVEPIDIPDDAEGRVAFITTAHLDDRDEPGPDASEPAPARGEAGLRLGSGWLAVAAVALGLIAVFAAGLFVLR